MGVILCATRGGEGSIRTQNEAITLAKMHGDEIVFLYIVDLKFLNKTAAPIVVDVNHEIEKMGEFLLLMAIERAEKSDVEARSIIRKGSVREEIINTANDLNVTKVVLGKPGGDESRFEMKSLLNFANDIEENTKAEVYLV